MLEDHGELGAALDAYRRTRAQRPSDKAAALGEMRVLQLADSAAQAVDGLVPLLQFYPDEPDDALGRCVQCGDALGDTRVLLVRHRGEHRIADAFCGVEHLLEWAKAGGRWR